MDDAAICRLARLDRVRVIRTTRWQRAVVGHNRSMPTVECMQATTASSPPKGDRSGTTVSTASTTPGRNSHNCFRSASLPLSNQAHRHLVIDAFAWKYLQVAVRYEAGACGTRRWLQDSVARSMELLLVSPMRPAFCDISPRGLLVPSFQDARNYEVGRIAGELQRKVATMP